MTVPQVFINYIFWIKCWKQDKAQFFLHLKLKKTTDIYPCSSFSLSLSPSLSLSIVRSLSEVRIFTQMKLYFKILNCEDSTWLMYNYITHLNWQKQIVSMRSPISVTWFNSSISAFKYSPSDASSKIISIKLFASPPKMSKHFVQGRLAIVEGRFPGSKQIIAMGSSELLHSIWHTDWYNFRPFIKRIYLERGRVG